MTKKQSLELIKLLSALESWSFSTGTKLPEYLLEDLTQAVRILEIEVLT